MDFDSTNYNTDELLNILEINQSNDFSLDNIFNKTKSSMDSTRLSDDMDNKEQLLDFLIESFKNYNPDLLFFGHTKNIDINTISEFKSLNKNLIITQWNEDPVMASLEYSKQNIANINIYADIVDHNFITTDPSIFIKQNSKVKNLHFFFFNVFNILFFCWLIFKI